MSVWQTFKAWELASWEERGLRLHYVSYWNYWMKGRDQQGHKVHKVQVMSVSEDVPKVAVTTIPTGFPIYWSFIQNIHSGQCYKRQNDPLMFSPTSFCSEECERVREAGLDSKEKMYQYRRAIAVHIMLIGFQHKLQKWIFRQLPREKKMYKNVSHHAFMPTPHFFTWIYCRKANENMYEYDLEATQNIWMFVELGTSFFFLVFTRMLLQKIKHLILFQRPFIFLSVIWNVWGLNLGICVCLLIFAFVFIFGCGR